MSRQYSNHHGNEKIVERSCAMVQPQTPALRAFVPKPLQIDSLQGRDLTSGTGALYTSYSAVGQTGAKDVVAGQLFFLRS